MRRFNVSFRYRTSADSHGTANFPVEAENATAALKTAKAKIVEGRGISLVNVFDEQIDGVAVQPALEPARSPSPARPRPQQLGLLGFLED